MSKIIKQICFIADSGRLILSDSDNNHFLCDIYGNKTKKFFPYISGSVNGRRRNELFPLSVNLSPSNSTSRGNNNGGFIEYFPTTRKFEGYSQFPRPIVPPFANIPNYELSQRGKRELIEQLRKYFSVDRMQYILGLQNENKSLDYLTCDLNKFDSVKEDTDVLMKLIENTIEEYKKIYKYKMNILYKNPVVSALVKFRKVLENNGDMKVINGRRLNRPNLDIQEKFYIINKIIDRKGSKEEVKVIPTDNNLTIEPRGRYLMRSDDGQYSFSPKRMFKFGSFSYERERLEEEKRIREEEERKIREEEERKEMEKKAAEDAKKPPVEEETKQEEAPKEEEEKKEELPPVINQEEEKVEEKVEEEKEDDMKRENISFISADTQAERRMEEEIKRQQREKELAEREVRFLSGFLEEKKKLKENVIIQKHQPPKLKTNGELFFENLSLLQKTNPIAYEHQKQKDEYDLKQLTRKRHQNKINADNIGFKK